MYTGLIESTGTLERVRHDGAGRTVRVATTTEDLATGDSVAVSGVCLTAERVGEGWFDASLSAETVERTYLADLDAGTAVNVERPVRADGRLDGHVVKGTVDATTELRGVTARDGDRWLTVATPAGYGRYLVEKGAVALDGVGLTVAAVDDDAGTFAVAVVPATDRRTTLPATRPGDPLHFEADVFAKYAERGRRCDDRRGEEGVGA
jgi:riboflavin synthase